MPVQTATARVIAGDISAETRRACSRAATVSVLTFCSCCSWRSSPPNALITSIDCRPSCSVASRSDCRFRTSLTAALTALLMRSERRVSSGVTASAMSAKSQRSKNITTIMPTNDSTSVTMVNVNVDAKL
jgi:hypothetical protein